MVRPTVSPASPRQLTRAPGRELQPFVQLLWAVQEAVSGSPPPRQREHVLPTGQMHLVFRLNDDPLRLFAHANDVSGRLVSDVVIGGARASFYIREVSSQCSVGAQLRPGAAEALFGIPAHELTGRHTPLADVWGRQVTGILERLAEEKTLEQRIDRLETILLTRLPGARGMHPAVARALERFGYTADVGRVVRECGYSHRTLISEFRRAVGLTPKEYTRVLRLQRALQDVSHGRSLADLAVDAGYSDQAHLSREFRAFSGVTPTDYRRISPSLSHHLPIGVSR
jgi:AraC-like DNA-binding protein